MPGEHIQPEHIEQLLDQSMVIAGLTQTFAPPVDEAASGNGSLIKEIEREMILQRLVANKGNQRRTAADLGLPKSTLHDRIRTYRIDLGALMKSFTT
jgi:DNA-binding NtrC family response regulator